MLGSSAYHLKAKMAQWHDQNLSDFLMTQIIGPVRSLHRSDIQYDIYLISPVQNQIFHGLHGVSGLLMEPKANTCTQS